MRRIVKPSIHMNNYKLRTKFFLLYIFCVLIPVILLDIVIMLIISQSEMNEQEKERRYLAERLSYDIESLFTECETAADSIYTDSELSRFLSEDYPTTNDYYDAYLRFQKTSGLNYIAKANGIQQIIIFADNPGILNGGYFYQMSYAMEQDWYTYYRQTSMNITLWKASEPPKNRFPIHEAFYILRQMDYFDTEQECYLYIMIDMYKIFEILEKETSEHLLYLFDTEENLIYTSNKTNLAADDMTGASLPAGLVQKWKGRIGHVSIKVTDTEWTAYIIDPSDTMWVKLFTSHFNILLVLAVLVLVPTMITIGIERSIIRRIELLKGRFDAIQNEAGALAPIPGSFGQDEIGSLIRHFNSMLLRITTLIDTVTSKTLEKNQLELLKARAELNALQSQVDPHFIYNILESICMRSMLKGEAETAQIMRDMSKLLREMSKWSQDTIFLYEEFSFIESYLRLQKYRFGESLDYKINLEETVRNIEIPKLTVISFVENACVHGLEESLTGGIINVTAKRTNQGTKIIITDNGAGMEDDRLKKIRGDITHADIGRMESCGSTGILNAYLRLRMRYGEAVQLTVDSAPEKGTYVTVFIDNV